jgi:hypothetical protein
MPVLSADGEIEVFPMTALDELHLVNPDGLINNESLFTVIQHVVPAIKNARTVLSPDLDVLFIAMRMATYGDTMDVEGKCTECDDISTHSVMLPALLATVKNIDAVDEITVDGFELKLKPYTLFSQSKLTDYMITIQRAARKLQFIEDNISNAHDIETLNKQTDASDEFKQALSNAVSSSSADLFEIAAESIERITTSNGTLVIKKEHITEWLKTLPAMTYATIRDALSELSKSCIDTSVSYKCSKCKHKNVLEVNFDPANFFGENLQRLSLIAR